MASKTQRLKAPEKKTLGSQLSWLVHQQLFIPLAALALLIIFNLIGDSSFFSIYIRTNNSGYKVLGGNIISVINDGSELAILAIGMTLVTAASGGQDISVGANMAIAGSVIMRILCGSESVANQAQNPVLLAFLAACGVCMLFGAFNGILVAYLKLQPMVATLILFTAGRSIASWINHAQPMNLKDPVLSYFGTYIPGVPIPTPVFIAVACMIVAALTLKFTTIGLYSQSVGINASSSRLNGINPAFIKFLTYVILGLCVAVAGFVKVSRVSTINYSNFAIDIEMDAILAVALGGNALSGGKFSMPASILGAYTIQFLTTTLYKYKVPSTALPAYKAVVVVILVVISAPTFQAKATKAWKKLTAKKSGSVKEAV